MNYNYKFEHIPKFLNRVSKRGGFPRILWSQVKGCCRKGQKKGFHPLPCLSKFITKLK